MTPPGAPSGVVTLLTDFGPGSVYVGQMHGVLLSRAPGVRVVDLSHDSPPGAVAAAGYLLQRSWRHFPPGTVHVAVVDPGVGSGRAVLAARAHGHLFLAPDNGLLGPVLEEAPEAEVHRVENRALMNDEVSHTFHGRDVFAPVAAHLAGGGALEAVGPTVEAEIARPGPQVDAEGVDGSVLLLDRFGNIVTNIPGSLLEGLGSAAGLRVRVGASFIDDVVRTFSDVPRGVALAYVGSGGHLEIAVNGGHAGSLLALQPGDRVRVERRAP
jgi:hypothetical protein